MSVRTERIRTLTTHTYAGGPILYWMSRDIRADDNWALLYAQELAVAHKVPLIVLYNLTPGFLGGDARSYRFKCEALMSVEKILAAKDIPFCVVHGEHTEKEIITFAQAHGVGAIVTDFSPLRISRQWVTYVQKHSTVPVYEVDAHNIVPCFIASDKQEYGAYTLRPKLHKLLPSYLEEFPALKKHSYHYDGKIDRPLWSTLCPEDVSDMVMAADHKSAHRAVAHFIQTKLMQYAEKRNDPNEDAQSNLSPYIHYGIVAPARIALDVTSHTGLSIEQLLARTEHPASIFLEELIVRRELSDNFCFYNPHYDTVQGFPLWAQKSHEKASQDTREYIYTKRQFESGSTHDALWNAAQHQMVSTGKMHGYMRMYWAKKILEWTKNPEDAMKIAIYLNDTYSLDGRDPNGYAGIAWSIGGVHDRAWFGRPVFGQVRYMNANGCTKKFDTETYIARWLPSTASGKLW